MIRHIYCGYSAAYSRHTGHKQPIRKQQRDKAALLYTGASPHLRERVQRAGEQSVTFGGRDEQRRNRATLFVKKAEQAFDSLLRLGAVDGTFRSNFFRSTE